MVKQNSVNQDTVNTSVKTESASPFKTFVGNGAGNGETSSATNAVALGNNAASALTTGNDTTAIGTGALAANTTGTNNTVLGSGGGDTIDGGANNTLVGYDAGSAYASTESSNILIGSSVAGTAAESNKLRIGAATGTGTGELDSAFIHGINGATPANSLSVVINSSTSQLSALTAPPITQVVQQVFTANGTYTPTSGMVYCFAEAVGGGGGGGGVAATGAGQTAAAGGGGAGGYAAGVFTAATIGASQSVTVGTGGAAGASGSNPGGNAGSSSLGAILVATGGTGGNGGLAATNTGTPVGNAGSGTTGQILTVGGQAGSGFGIGSLNFAIGCPGGNSVYGGAAGAAQVGRPYGGGAGGVVNGNSTGASGGFAGADGVVIITEYVSA